MVVSMKVRPTCSGRRQLLVYLFGCFLSYEEFSGSEETEAVTRKSHRGQKRALQRV